MVRRNEEILAQVLSMDEKQLEKFLSDLKPDALEYLDIILEKAEKNPAKILKYAEYVQSEE